jgi:hypothetical protein
MLLQKEMMRYDIAPRKLQEGQMTEFCVKYGVLHDKVLRCVKSREAAVGAAAENWLSLVDLVHDSAVIVEKQEDGSEKTVIDTPQLVTQVLVETRHIDTLP